MSHSLCLCTSMTQPVALCSNCKLIWALYNLCLYRAKYIEHLIEATIFCLTATQHLQACTPLVILAAALPYIGWMAALLEVYHIIWST